ncbi:MAG: putative Zn-dependent protease [Bacteroidia bacterium]|jgi:predicted Zn-dependent protease
MNKTFRDLLILTGGFGAIWLAFVLVPWEMDEPGLEISVEKEMELGETMIEDWIFESGEMDVVSNPTLDSAMHIISDRLLEQLDSSEFNHHIWVVDQDEINAFTLPGGYIIVNQGLIKFSEHPEEVAGVIAHELGHVEERHVVSRLIKELGVAILFTALGGSDAILLNEVGRTAVSTAFDRSQEEEADEFATALLQKANLDPRVLATFFRRLKNEHGYDERVEMFMTHPHHNARIKSALEIELPEGFGSEPFEFDWERVKNSIQ